MTAGFKDKLDQTNIYWCQCVLEISFYRIKKTYLIMKTMTFSDHVKADVIPEPAVP